MKSLLCIFCIIQVSLLLYANDDNLNKKSEGIVKINSINDEDNAFKDADRGKLYQYEDVKIIPLETNRSCLLSEVVDISFADSLIFVLDFRNGLFVFDKNTGTFLNKIGQKGEGPEEYLTSNSYFLDETKRTVTIIDEMKNILLEYDFDGKFRSRKGILPDLTSLVAHSILVDDNTILSNYYMFGRKKTAYNLFKRNNLKLLDEKLYNPIEFIGFAHMFSKHPMAKNGDKVNFIMPLCDTIFSCYNGKFVPSYIIEHKNKMAPRDKFVIEPNSSFGYFKHEYGRKGFFTGFSGYFETKKYMFLNFENRSSILGAFFADKEKGKGGYLLYVGSSEDVVKSMQDIPLESITSCVDDYFVSCCLPETLFNMKISKRSKDPVVRKLKEVVDNLQEDDNPILIFYKLKDYFNEK